MVKAEEAIPTERDLAEEFDVSRITVRKAIDHTANTVLGVNDIIADIEGQRLGSHVWEAFLINVAPLGLRASPGAVTGVKAAVGANQQRSPVPKRDSSRPARCLTQMK